MLLGLFPRQVDELTFPEYRMLIAASEEKEKRQWQHTLALCTTIYNSVGAFGKRGKPMSHLYDEIFGRPVPGDSQVEEWKRQLKALKDAPKNVILNRENFSIKDADVS